MALTLDWANFALSIGFVTARIIKLLVTSVIFVGKIDTPLLQDGAITSKLDKIPHIFLKDVLLHEAHRHPYIEQLGLTYLMKLRYRNDFGKQSGSNWRLLFVYALMPWMSNYRIQSAGEDEVVEEQALDVAAGSASSIEGNDPDTAEMEALRLIDQISQQQKLTTVRLADGEKASPEDLQDHLTLLKKQLRKLKKENKQINTKKVKKKKNKGEPSRSSTGEGFEVGHDF